MRPEDLDQIADEAKRMEWQLDGAFGRSSRPSNLVRYHVPALIAEVRRLQVLVDVDAQKRAAELGPEPKTPTGGDPSIWDGRLPDGGG